MIAVDKINERIGNMGLKKSYVAREIGVSASKFSKILRDETGKVMTIGQAEKLAKILCLQGKDINFFIK